MSTEVNLTRFFAVDKSKVFQFFTEAKLLEKWASPEGMTLSVPLFESKVGGNYRYEHNSKEGLYVCTGHITEFVQDERIIQHDDVVKGPDGKIVFENLDSTINFSSKPGGTEVQIIQTGFKDEEGASECEIGWAQSLDRLTEILSKEAGFDVGPFERGHVNVDRGHAHGARG